MPAARRACVTPGRTARRESFSSSGPARSRPPPATRRRRAGAASAPGSAPGMSDRQASTTSSARARSSSVSISRQPPSTSTGRSATPRAATALRPSDEVGLAQRRGGAERRVQPARERLAPDGAQRGRALRGEAGEPDELAGGVLRRDQPLADAGDDRRRRRVPSTRASSASLTGCSGGPRRRHASGDRRSARSAPSAAATRRACSCVNTMSEYENRNPSAISASA